jgi:hypothetical protein
MRLIEQRTAREWGMIGSIGHDKPSGTIRQKHRVQPAQEVLAWNLRILDTGLKTQNYDKGLERFIRKFGPAVPT